MLDELISQYYEILKSDEEKSVTLGDLIKMMELKRKLAPTGANQGEFWKMLEEIRRGTLSKREKAAAGSASQKKTSVTKKRTK